MPGTVGLSRGRFIFLAFNISTVYIALGLLLSLQPPFYPSEAEKKGATPAEYGFVFGIANLSLFLFSPLFGKFGSKIGPKLCFNIGAILQGASGFAFAFLPWVPTVGGFIGLSYLLRFLEGMGTAMAWSSCLGILIKIFPNKVARIMSWTQTCFGLGYMFGPGAGAGLYEIGGFALPFLVVGAVSVVLSFCLICSIPDLAPQSHSNGQANGQANGHVEGHDVAHSRLRFRTIITSLQLLLPFVDLFAALCGNGMLESMLEPHLKSTGASTVAVGITFLLFGCCYMLGNLFFGTVMDKIGNPLLFSIFGNLLFMTAFLLVGPVPFLPVKPSEHLIQGSMALAGLAYSSLVVSSFSRAQKRVIEMGYPDDINTYVMISGIWLSAFALGNFAGPTLAGLMVQTEGFRTTTLVFFSLYVLMFFVDVVQTIVQFVQERRRIQNGYESIS